MESLRQAGEKKMSEFCCKTGISFLMKSNEEEDEQTTKVFLTYDIIMKVKLFPLRRLQVLLCCFYGSFPLDLVWCLGIIIRFTEALCHSAGISKDFLIIFLRFPRETSSAGQRHDIDALKRKSPEAIFHDAPFYAVKLSIIDWNNLLTFFHVPS